MGWMINLVLTLQVLSAIGIIVLVLLQQGKGADMGAAFGSGSAGSLFGATGSANFLSRTTAILATVFFVATLALSYLATQSRKPAGAGSVMQNASEVPTTAPAVPTSPAAPAGAPAASSVPTAPVESGAKK